MKYDRKLENGQSWQCGIIYSWSGAKKWNIDFYSKNELIAQINWNNWLFIPTELTQMTVTQRKHLNAFLAEYAPHVSQTDVDLIAGTSIGIMIKWYPNNHE